MFLRRAMVVYPCDIHKVSRLLTGKKGQLRKEVPSVAMMTNFGFGLIVNKKKWLTSKNSAEKCIKGITGEN